MSAHDNEGENECENERVSVRRNGWSLTRSGEMSRKISGRMSWRMRLRISVRMSGKRGGRMSVRMIEGWSGRMIDKRKRVIRRIGRATRRN